jgi:hypothetical protein
VESTILDVGPPARSNVIPRLNQMSQILMMKWETLLQSIIPGHQMCVAVTVATVGISQLDLDNEEERIPQRDGKCFVLLVLFEMFLWFCGKKNFTTQTAVCCVCVCVTV